MNLENSKTLLVGLWNPHSKYSKTRHNIGADILERLIVQNSLEIKLDKSGMYKSGTLIIEENSIVGAGSVITKKVRRKSLALTRSLQTEVKNYKRKRK